MRTKRGVTVAEQCLRLPDGSQVSDYLQIRMPACTTVLAMTDDDSFVCIRQYKHGMGRVALTLPGGIVETAEEPLDAAKRELLEETGYRCTDWQALGDFVIGGNQGIGMAHHYLARCAVKVTEPNSGDLEEMRIELLTRDRLRDELSAGNFPILSHACAIALAAPRLMQPDVGIVS